MHNAKCKMHNEESLFIVHFSLCTVNGISGGADGARTRDLQRDRLAF